MKLDSGAKLDNFVSGRDSSKIYTVLFTLTTRDCLLRLPAGLRCRLKWARRYTRAQCASRCRRSETITRQHHVPRVPSLSPGSSRHRRGKLSTHLHKLTLLSLVLCYVVVQLQANEKCSTLPATVRPSVDGVIATWKRAER